MPNDNIETAITKGGGALPTQAGVMSNLAEAYKLARVFASSQLVPKHLQGKPDDCFIALLMAEQLNENALMVMQNIAIVQGTAGWKATFAIARANAHGPFDGPIEFRTDGKGEGISVTAYAKVEKTGRVVERTVSMAMAKASGWTSNAKYQQIPEQMLSYRAACFLVRLYCPEVLLGMQTEDELEDVAGSRRAGRLVGQAIDGVTSGTVDVLNGTAPANTLPATTPNVDDPAAEFRADAAKIDAGGDL